jgi:hypothetical protein
MIFRPFSEIEGAFVLALFAVIVLLLYLYAFEFFRYRTVRNKFKRKYNVILPLWMSFFGFYILIRSSLVPAGSASPCAAGGRSPGCWPTISAARRTPSAG